MNNEIIKSDTGLLFFRALRHGIESKFIDDALLNQFKKEGSEMSFAFAKKYYSVIFEAYLRHASHCVLGVMNLGLIEATDNLAPKAVDLLLNRGLVGAFREGWSRILNLVQRARAADKLDQKSEFEWEKDFADSLSAEPGRKWIGYDEYQYNMSIYCKRDVG